MEKYCTAGQVTGYNMAHALPTHAPQCYVIRTLPILYLIQTSGVPRGGSTLPPPEIQKALQNRAKLNPIVKTVKYLKIAEFKKPTPQDVWKKGQ